MNFLLWRLMKFHVELSILKTDLTPQKKTPEKLDANARLDVTH